MIHVRTVPISVPSWVNVVLHVSEESRYSGEPVPDLDEVCEEALISRRLLIATYQIADEQRKGEQVEHPFAISGAPGPYYAYRDDPDNRKHPALGRLIRTYGFYEERPESLDTAYDYEPGDADFEIVITEGGQYALLMEADSHEFVIPLGSPGDSIVSVMARVAAAAFVLNGLDGIFADEILPYTKDTKPIAAARLGHILRWQFETSRIKPLYA